MPTPISHIVLTERIYKKFFKNEDRLQFYIGTCFSDIDKVAKIKKKQTHIYPLYLEDINEDDSPFQKGFKIHSLMDIVRNRYVLVKKVYKLLPETKYKKHAFKILEEVFLYNEIEDWNEYILFLDNILIEEINFNKNDLNQETILNWHKTLQKYFKQKPNKESVEELFFDVCSTRGVGEDIYKVVEVIQKDERIIRELKELHKHIDSFFGVNKV